jgi:uncharacterized protein
VPQAQLIAWLRADAMRWDALAAVRSLNLFNGYIAAGFIRNCVWSQLHGFATGVPDDVDVIWFDEAHAEAETDREFEAALRHMMPNLNWSVKNQARMHRRNNDAPYMSIADAMTHWPETATAIAVAQISDEKCEIVAPFGLGDLMELRLRPTPHFAVTKRAIFDARVAKKRWLERFPKLVLVDA